VPVCVCLETIAGGFPGQFDFRISPVPPPNYAGNVVKAIEPSRPTTTAGPVRGPAVFFEG